MYHFSDVGPKAHQIFIQTYISGKTPDYDMVITQ